MNKTIIQIAHDLEIVFIWFFCIKCGKQYVGETKNTIFTCMIQYRYNITNKKDTQTPLVQHFIFHGLDSVRVATLERNLIWTDVERRKRERKWIYLLNIRTPFGFNFRERNPTPYPNPSPISFPFRGQAQFPYPTCWNPTTTNQRKHFVYRITN